MLNESKKDKLVDLLKKLAVTVVVVFYVIFVMGKFNSIFDLKSTLFASGNDRNSEASLEDNKSVDQSNNEQDDQDPKDNGGTEDQNGEQEDEGQNQPDNSQNPVQPVKQVVEIAPGSPVVTVANTLKREGLIKDVDEFLSVVAEMNAESKIMAGTFTISSDATYQQIVKILIGQI